MRELSIGLKALERLLYDSRTAAIGNFTNRRTPDPQPFRYRERQSAKLPSERAILGGLVVVQLEFLSSMDESGSGLTRYFSRAELSWTLAGLSRQRSERVFVKLVADKVLAQAALAPGGASEAGTESAEGGLRGAHLEPADCDSVDRDSGETEAARRCNPGFYQPRYSLGRRSGEELRAFANACNRLRVPVDRVLPGTP